ncbi:MAG: Na/Pi cotransporter family protein [bacterium]|nr:Na/Pi cotransporter family protein [bacterium]
MSIQGIGNLFEFIGGLGLFLYGMNSMADGLQKSTGSKTKKLMGFLTNNRLMGVLVGALITALIQSSSATTVMVVGFVNAGMLSLIQAVGVIMGANIGTTITAWIVSMNQWGSVFKPEFFAPLIVGIGSFLLMFSHKEGKRDVGNILVGFGVLFIGLSFMSSAIKPYRDSQLFVSAFSVLGKNPILAILVGTVVTAIIQSSSASVSILQTLAINGIVNWYSAIFITLGQNIGTCVTALISCAGAQKNAKRAAVIHLLFNVAGAVIFGIIMFILFSFNRPWANATINTVEISIFHTVFNVANTLILFPFAKVLVKLSQIIIKDDKEEEKPVDLVTQMKGRLDHRLYDTPNFAIEAGIKEVVEMGNITLDNTEHAIYAFMNNDKEMIKSVFEREKEINELEKVLTEYLVWVDNLNLNERQHGKIKNLLYTVNDIERMGDHSENLVELAEDKIRDGLTFSPAANAGLDEICSYVIKAVETALECRMTENVALAETVNEYEDKVDAMQRMLRDEHIKRLSKSLCTAENGVVYMDFISNLERISDHAHNIVGYIQEE